jgi:hypothetical protein
LGVDALHDIEPIEDEHNANPFTGAQQPSPTRIPGLANSSSLSLSRFSTFSMGSVLSLRSAGTTYSLVDLCDQVIEKYIWLQTARIISTSCYYLDRNFIRHRFLILQLQRLGKKDIWMRIDRKAGLGIFSLVRKGGKTRATDTVSRSRRRRSIAEFAAKILTGSALGIQERAH